MDKPYLRCPVAAGGSTDCGARSALFDRCHSHCLAWMLLSVPSRSSSWVKGSWKCWWSDVSSFLYLFLFLDGILSPRPFCGELRHNSYLHNRLSRFRAGGNRRLKVSSRSLAFSLVMLDTMHWDWAPECCLTLNKQMVSRCEYPPVRFMERENWDDDIQRIVIKGWILPQQHQTVCMAWSSQTWQNILWFSWKW